MVAKRSRHVTKNGRSLAVSYIYGKIYGGLDPNLRFLHIENSCHSSTSRSYYLLAYTKQRGMEIVTYIALSTFGSKKPQQLDTLLLNLLSLLKRVHLRIILHANILPQITGPIQRGPLLEKIWSFLELFLQEN